MAKKKIPLTIPTPRPRTEVPEDKAAAFVAGGKVAKSAPKSTPRRRAGQGERLPAYVPPEIAEAARMYCAKNKCSTSHLVSLALSRLLDVPYEV